MWIWSNTKLCFNFFCFICNLYFVTKKAVRIIAKVGYRESTAEILKELKFLRVDQINEMEISILM